jgi:hypothetical protein
MISYLELSFHHQASPLSLNSEFTKIGYDEWGMAISPLYKNQRSLTCPYLKRRWINGVRFHKILQQKAHSDLIVFFEEEAGLDREKNSLRTPGK